MGPKLGSLPWHGQIKGQRRGVGGAPPATEAVTALHMYVNNFRSASEYGYTIVQDNLIYINQVSVCLFVCLCLFICLCLFVCMSDCLCLSMFFYLSCPTHIRIYGPIQTKLCKVTQGPSVDVERKDNNYTYTFADGCIQTF